LLPPTILHMDNPEHSFEFDAQINTPVHQTVTEEEYKDFSREDESLEEYARRKAKENAPLDLTKTIADNGIKESAIEIGKIKNHRTYP